MLASIIVPRFPRSAAFVLVTALGIATVAVADEPIRVERVGTAREHPAPWPERPHVRARFERSVVRIEINGWTEGCTLEGETPAFSIAVDGRTIRITRGGPVPRPICDDSPHSDSFCAGPDGEMMDCPRPICVCQYRVTAETAVVGRGGRYQVLVADGRRVRARTTVIVPSRDRRPP